MLVITRDEFDLNIINNAVYWTAILYKDKLGQARTEHETFEKAAECVNLHRPDRALIYAVKEPLSSPVAGYVNGKWTLHQFRDKKLEHPLACHFISGICKNP